MEKGIGYTSIFKFGLMAVDEIMASVNRRLQVLLFLRLNLVREHKSQHLYYTDEKYV
ncbi:MAG: hypothetical protein V3T58_08155 [Candidatus Hydrothermarchaeales archaeon]